MLMDSTFFLTVVAVAIGFVVLLGTPFLLVYRKFRFPLEKRNLGSSSSSPSSTTLPSSLSCKWTHDVFPSFRGEDVRRNFLSHIQKEFRRKGITLFIDNDIKRGESIGRELIQAIRSSKIAVVLLSKNYASSKWCLEELVEIMKCKDELGQKVFAIFYEVDPSEVRKLTGDFGVIFKKSCAGKTKEDVERWRQALEKVAAIAGYDSRNWDNEAVMIEDIVAEISKTMINSAPSSDFEGLIGMGAHMENMKLLLCLSSDEVRMIGIWGPPGIGKTTIARFLYDLISGGFQLSVFMKMEPSYTRPTCSDDHDEKLHLEQQFLSQLINQEDIKIPHLGAAQNFLIHKKVLVIFDGVDQLVQLHAMPKAQCLGPGTRIIITTQNQKLLKAFEIEHNYRVNLPPDDEALQIFCMSAFGQTSPKDGFEKLAWEVTNLVGRLPLGLKVMGSHFRGILSKREWKSELSRLRVRFDRKIGSILKFSYDALEEEDKDLFLYIACFFVQNGLNDGTFEDVLGHKFSNVQQGIQVLVQRSLVSMDSRKYYSMHDLLVQLGKEIVRNQSIHKPGKRQFLVDAKEICDVLTDNRGSNIVIGINLDISRILNDSNISARAFEKMSNLQYIRFHYGFTGDKRLHLPQGLNCLPPKLRILRWDYCPLTCLPPNFNPELLVKIKMENSKLEKLWDGIQPLRNLKLMNLNGSKNLKELPDVSTATNLIKLEFQGCSSLVELPFSIGNLTSLQKLNLEGCPSLLRLPFSIGNLTNLQELNLKDCSRLHKLPSSIGSIKCLSRLRLSACLSLVELPSSIGNLTNLQNLNLEGCSSLLKLPSTIGNVKNLQILNLRGYYRRFKLFACFRLVELPSSIGNLTNLKELNLEECSSLLELPSSIENLTNLQELNLRGCSSLVKLPSSIGNAKNIQSLDLFHCSSLVELPSSIENITSLQELNLRGCSSLVKLPSSIGNLTNLQELDLAGCSSLLKLPSSIWNAKNLQSLNLYGCSSLVELPLCIRNAIHLKKLKLGDCSNLMELLSSIGNASNLENLSLKECNLMELPSSIGDASNIKQLSINDLSRLLELPSSIGNLKNLNAFELGHCSNLVKLPSSIGNLINLYSFELSHCSNLVELPSSIENLSNLEKLDIRGCSNLVELPSSIGNIINLRKLSCDGLSSLSGLPSSIGNLTNLQSLDLDDCSNMVELPFSIGNLQMLNKLILRRCSKLEVLPTNINLGSLKELDVTGCSQLRSFPVISTNIMWLKLCGTLIKEVPLSIKSWSKLKHLSITYCKDLEEFPHVLDIITELELSNAYIEEIPPWVSGISCLDRLVLNNCRNLVSLPQLPDSLSSLVAENCDSLERLACSFPNPDIRLTFVNCWKLNEEARDIIIKTSLWSGETAVLPGKEVPAFFTYRSTSGGSLTVKLNQRCFPTSLRFKLCILLVSEGDKRAQDERDAYVSCKIVEKLGGLHTAPLVLEEGCVHPPLQEHVYMFQVQAKNVESSELFFEFKTDSDIWEVSECGVREL